MSEEKKPQKPKAKPKAISPHIKGKGDPKLQFGRTPKSVALLHQQAAFKAYNESALKFKMDSALSQYMKKLNEKFIQEYCIELIKGHYPEIACKMLNVSFRILGEWLHKGRQDAERIDTLVAQGVKIRDKDITIEHKLYVNVQRALHLAEDRDLMRINVAAEIGLWQAAAWKLERRQNRRWGRKDTADVNLNANITNNVNHVILTPDEHPDIKTWQEQRIKRDAAQKTIEHFQNLPLEQGAQNKNFEEIME